jgi:membrane protein
METQVHVFAFSIAANVLLAFFPFLIVMVCLCRYWLHWDSGVDAIFFALGEFFPETGNSAWDGGLGWFLKQNLKAAVWQSGNVQLGSLALLMFTANGVFLPMEVALNRAWGVKDRTFWSNQIISMVLIVGCGLLALAAISLTAVSFSGLRYFAPPGSWIWNNIGSLTLNLSVTPVAVIALWLIYWLLPNRQLKPLQVFPAALIVGVTIGIFKYAFFLIYPWLFRKLSIEYGPFKHSVTLILVSFFAAMLILAGAEASARVERVRSSENPTV